MMSPTLTTKLAVLLMIAIASTASTHADPAATQPDQRAEKDAAVLATLDKRCQDLRFNANSFTDVINFLSDATGLKIDVDWDALDKAHISRDAPVTARLRDIKYSKALKLIFKSVEGAAPERKLDYLIRDGKVLITTRAELDKAM